MANWFDFLSLTVTVAIIGGIVYGIITVSKAISASVETTKQSLKNKGYTISDKGVAIKTSKRFDREDYVDATQRGFVKAMGASSFGKSSLQNNANPTSPLSPPGVKRSSTAGSSASFGSVGEEKKNRNPFKRTSSHASK